MIGKIPHKEALVIFQKINNKLKKSNTYKKLCEEYGVDLDFIDLVPMAFADLDVSARTEKGCIYFNYSLDEEELDHYAAHEYTHVLQQCFGDGPTEGSDGDDYLDNKFEQEGFRAQTEYLSETRDDQEAEEYIEKVLDHHDVDGKERDKKKKDLLELASRINFITK